MMKELLKFEENEEILNFKYSNGDLIWPYFRTIIYTNIMYTLDNNNNNIYYSEKKTKLLDYLKNPYLISKKEILFFYSNSTNIINDKGEYFNRIYDYYSLIFEKNTGMIEVAIFKSHEKPRVLKNVYYEDLINELVEKQYKVQDVNVEDKKISSEFINYLKRNLPYSLNESIYNYIEKEVLKLSVTLKYYYVYYEKLFKQIKPKVIFFEDACYGTRAYAIKLANRMGIATAEFQHGFIGLEHRAYNYSELIYNNEEYKEYMPQYYLTFGEFWNKNVRLPIEKIIIGNPHYHNNLKKNNYIRNNNKIKNILILSGGVLLNEFKKLTLNLAERIKGEKYKIIYRVHPVERTNLKQYEEFKQFSNIIINDSGDVYDDIYNADFIVGDYTTALFEAVGFNKKILIYGNVYSEMFMEKDFGTWFYNENELYNYISNPDCIKDMNDIDYYWDSKWEENYIKFINRFIKLQ
jgi:Putative glycosyl/glycerophosphate transferases involved in teichoic acid biosynthesis TagF/TagB/EpsJ/RodC